MPFIEYDCKMHDPIEISQYGVLSLFIVTKYTCVSMKIILDYTSVT